MPSLDGCQTATATFGAGTFHQRRKQMEKQSESTTQPVKEAMPMKLLPGSDLFDRIQEMSNSIARRAFEIFEDRGSALGSDLEDWLRAESEFLHPIHLDITESDDAITVHAEVPGFSAKEFEVGVEPHPTARPPQRFGLASRSEP
jgi:HSP20 family molecular chaperone IbpA